MKKNTKIWLIAIAIALAVIIAAGVLFFVLRKQEYTVTFDTDGGTSISSIKIKENETFDFPNKPTKEGYKFIGWTLENGTPVLAKFKVKEDIKLFAKWISEEIETFTVTFDTDGGTEIEALTVVKGETLKLPNEPKKEGYTFDGWIDKNETPIYEEALLSEDIILKARWKEEEKKEKTEEKSKEEVKNIGATSISVDKNQLDLIIGESGKLTATVNPSDAKDKTVTWSSSNSDIISVDSNGNLNAKAIGNAIITAKTSNGKTATATVYSDVESISISASNTYIAKYGNGVKSTALQVNVSPSSIDTSKILWNAPDASGPNAAASFSGSGKSVTITARDTWGDSLAKIPVTVSIGKKSASTAIYVEPELKITKATGDEATSEYTYESRNSFALQSNIDVTWTLNSDDYIVSVSANNARKYSAQLYNNRPYPQGFAITAKSKAGQTRK